MASDGGDECAKPEMRGESKSESKSKSKSEVRWHAERPRTQPQHGVHVELASTAKGGGRARVCARGCGEKEERISRRKRKGETR
jgi:hypothetical protein